MLRIMMVMLATIYLTQTPVQAQVPATVGAVADTANQNITLLPSTKRRFLGYGRLTSNDLIGDGQDRWRTGSITVSRAWGYSWDGTAPTQFGELLETRFQGQIIAPGNLARVNPGDRPFVGAVALGLHTHVYNHGIEYALGLDLVVIGPQTRLDQLQKGFHKLIGEQEPSDAVLAMQIANQLRPTVVAEMGRTFSINETLNIRPFAEFRAGDETLARVGVDLTFGSVGKAELLSRESVTGQRYRLIYRSTPGFSLVIGGDMAYVSNSVYLPGDRGYQLTDRRDRLRIGVHWQGKNASAFYGFTYLGPEFTSQSDGQVTGSVRIKLRF